jgi:hypothetical protein
MKEGSRRGLQRIEEAGQVKGPTKLINRQGQCSNAPTRDRGTIALSSWSWSGVLIFFPSPQAGSKPGPLDFVEMVYHEMTELAMAWIG